MAESDRVLHVPSKFAPHQAHAVHDESLAAPILRSWQRCSALGLQRDAQSLLEPLPAHALRQVVESSESLTRRYRPDLEALHATMRGADGIAVLTDASGLILDTIGTPSFADRAAQVSLLPGVSWAESATGTNAVGTAIVEGRAIIVNGHEHFCTRNRILSCAAAPIVDPHGTLLGVFDFSSHAQAAAAGALTFVQRAVDAIEHRLFDVRFAGCETVRLHTDAAILGTTREGILVFRDGLLVAANRHGLSLLDLGWDALGHRTYKALFPGERSVGADAILLRDTQGRTVHARPALRERPSAPALKLPEVEKPAPPARPTQILDANGKASLVRAARLPDAGVPLLIQGETGTGKEVFARAAHAASARAAKPFVAINCTALPEGLIEAELFGYESGAFTGARRGGAKGLLREADGGLLFLDEIGDMPLALQPRLLRVLQEREVMPVGATKATPIDVTLICATHRNLSHLVDDGSFRADLFFRIAPYTVELPPLRTFDDRGKLVRTLWMALDPAAKGVTLSRPCEAALAAYAWPGNFRQLDGTLRAILALADPGEVLGLDALPSNLRHGQTAPGSVPLAGANDPNQLDMIARSAMREALAASGGNVSKAAKRLGISRSTLYRRYFSGGPPPP